MTLTDLTLQISAICPITGCNSDGVIFYTPEATPQQRADANAMMAQLLPSLIELAPR